MREQTAASAAPYSAAPESFGCRVEGFCGFAVRGFAVLRYEVLRSSGLRFCGVVVGGFAVLRMEVLQLRGLRFCTFAVGGFAVLQFEVSIAGGYLARTGIGVILHEAASPVSHPLDGATGASYVKGPVTGYGGIALSLKVLKEFLVSGSTWCDLGDASPNLVQTVLYVSGLDCLTCVWSLLSNMCLV